MIKQFLFYGDLKDFEKFKVLVEGCKVHADIIDLTEDENDFNFLNLTEFKDLEYMAYIGFPTQESIETFTDLLSTIDFDKPSLFRAVLLGSKLSILTLEEFHRYVFNV